MLKDGLPIEAGVAEVGFTLYFRVVEKNLADEPGFFEKGRLDKSGKREIPYG